jgi:DNA polymerase-3 subunit delta
MLAAMSHQPPQVTLVLGPETFLAERAVGRVVAAVRAADPDADVRRLEPSSLEPGQLAELTSPSLFGETTVLVLDRAHELSGDLAAEVAAVLRDPAEHVVLVVVHGGAANRAKAVLEACRAVRATEVECPTPKPSERLRFVRGEIAGAGRSIAEDAAQVLVEAVGSDLRELANACAQLVSDTEGPITASAVQRYYAGRAEVSSFQVADLTIDGRTSDALEQLRFALGCGVAPVLLTSALAQGLRQVGRLASAPQGARAADLARDLGMPPWKVDIVRRQARGWAPDGLARAIAAVAEADASVKGMGGAADPGYALEKAVLAVTAARSV